MMLTGLYLMFAGGRFYKVTLFMSGMMSVTFLLTIIMFSVIYPDNSPTWSVYLTLAVTMGMGSGIGYMSYRWARVGVLLVGSWVGAIFGVLIYSLFFDLFIDDDRTLAVWLTVSISAFLVAIGSMFFFDIAVILGSSISGAYLFIRVIFSI